MMSSNSLSFFYEAEDSWHGQLKVVAETCGFRVRGAAWFPIDDLREFVQAIGVIPIVSGGEPKLEGGYWSKAGIEEVHVGLSITPFNSTGALEVLCTLAEPFANGDFPGRSADCLRLSLLTTYGDLLRFQAAFSRVIEGTMSSAALYLLQPEY